MNKGDMVKVVRGRYLNKYGEIMALPAASWDGYKVKLLGGVCNKLVTLPSTSIKKEE